MSQNTNPFFRPGHDGQHWPHQWRAWFFFGLKSLTITETRRPRLKLWSLIYVTGGTFKQQERRLACPWRLVNNNTVLDTLPQPEVRRLVHRYSRHLPRSTHTHGSPLTTPFITPGSGQVYLDSIRRWHSAAWSSSFEATMDVSWEITFFESGPIICSCVIG